jgi:hypothetical protein
MKISTLSPSAGITIRRTARAKPQECHQCRDDQRQAAAGEEDAAAALGSRKKGGQAHHITAPLVHISVRLVMG